MDEVEALADDLVILHNGQSVIESVSVEEMKKMHGGGGDEPSLEKAFLNFIAKAKEEEGEEDDIILPLEEVGVAAATSGDIDNNDDEKTTKTRRVLRQVQAILRARYLVWKRQPLFALFAIVSCAIFFTIGLSLAKSGSSANGSSALSSSEYAAG
jgi:ABC-type multidrug transport system ATPase subunit